MLDNKCIYINMHEYELLHQWEITVSEHEHPLISNVNLISSTTCGQLAPTRNNFYQRKFQLMISRKRLEQILVKSRKLLLASSGFDLRSSGVEATTSFCSLAPTRRRL